MKRNIFKYSPTEQHAIDFLKGLSFDIIKSIGISTAGYFEAYWAEQGKKVTATTLDRKGIEYTKNLLKEIEKTENIYSNTFISRPYIDRIDKSKSAHWFDKLKQIWKDKDILIVEGNFTRSGLGNDLFANTKSIKRIIAPSKNAYQKISEIEQMIRENAEDRLILLMLGPTAKLIVDDLQDLKNQLIDLGHIDSEYEWYKMKTLYAVALPNKHSAEFDLGVTLKKDTTFDNEVVAEIK